MKLIFREKIKNSVVEKLINIFPKNAKNFAKLTNRPFNIHIEAMSLFVNTQAHYSLISRK